MITVEGRFSNIYFAKETIVDTLDIYGNIIKIGTNYNEIKVPDYDIITAKPKRTNRGRKPKPKVVSKRKQQGTENYFHSQVTFTFFSAEKKKCYHFKLFVNGSFQIPCITNEDIESVKTKPELIEMMNYLKDHNIFNIKKEEPIELLYLMSILNNYKVNLEFVSPLDPTINFNLDIIRFKRVMDLYKVDETIFRYKLMGVIYNPAKFTGLRLVFYTPRDLTDDVIQNKVRINKSKKKNKTTIIIFGSCKINISSNTGRDTVADILDDLMKIIDLYKDEIFYFT
jgi:hypothetical protein